MSEREAVQKAKNTVYSVQTKIAAYKRNHPGEPTEFEQFIMKMVDDLGHAVVDLGTAVELSPGYKRIP